LMLAIHVNISLLTTISIAIINNLNTTIIGSY
jgi:hypothetical protein